jgi:hypothetical protein
MAEHNTHDQHAHEHASGCGHTAVRHDDHVDYLHEGHLHNVHEGHVDEHTLGVSSANPQDCAGGHGCGGHDASHTHDATCGHESVPHGNHTDYVVDGHLHNNHASHCDDHGKLVTA